MITMIASLRRLRAAGTAQAFMLKGRIDEPGTVAPRGAFPAVLPVPAPRTHPSLQELGRKGYSDRTLAALLQHPAFRARLRDQLCLDLTPDAASRLREQDPQQYASLAVAAIRFFHKHVLLQDLVLDPLDSIPPLLSREEVARLLPAPDRLDHRLLLWLLCRAGLRPAEVAGLRKDQVASAGLRSGGRLIPLPPAVAKDFRFLLKWADPHNPFLFPQGRHGHLAVLALHGIVKEAARTARITKIVSAHILRASAATHSIEADLVQAGRAHDGTERSAPRVH